MRRLRPRFVVGQTAAPKLIFIQLCDRLLRLVLGAHLNERKPTRAPRGHVAHHFHRFHRAGAAEQLLELRFSGFIREISDIQLSTHDLTPLPRNATTLAPPRRRTVSTASKGTIRGPEFRLVARKSGRSESGEARNAENQHSTRQDPIYKYTSCAPKYQITEREEREASWVVRQPAYSTH